MHHSSPWTPPPRIYPAQLVATEYLSLDGFFHEPDQWSRLFLNEEATQFQWTELQTSDAKPKRVADGGFKVLGAA